MLERTDKTQEGLNPVGPVPLGSKLDSISLENLSMQGPGSLFSGQE